MSVIPFFFTPAANSGGGTSPPVTAGQATPRSPIHLGQNVFDGIRAIPLLVNYTTAGSDYLLWKPTTADLSVALLGFSVVSAASANVSFKSNATFLEVLAFGGNSGLIFPLSPTKPEIILNSEPGESLIINADAVFNRAFAYIAEMKL